MRREAAYAMIRRRAIAAGIETRIGNRTFRATGITTYLKNGGLLEGAAAIANHSSTRTTQLYDRCRDETSLNEIERIRLSPTAAAESASSRFSRRRLLG